jgi:hypothetical protein
MRCRRVSDTGWLLFLLHRAATAFDGASTAFGHNYLRAAFSTDINFTELISHFFCLVPEIQLVKGEASRLRELENR